MADIRAENDGERDLILNNTEAWIVLLAAASKLHGIYEYIAKASFDNYRATSTAHRSHRQAHNLNVETLRAAVAAVHEAVRELFMHTQMKHGTAGLNKLESLLGGLTRSELSRLPRNDVINRVGGLLTALSTGFSLHLNEAMVEAVRVAHAALLSAQQQEASSRVTRKQSSAALAVARVDFDRDSVRFMRVVDGDPEAAGLVIDLAAYRRNREASDESEETNDAATDLSAISI